jgi:AcrR family transcriptional regulator
LTASSLFGKSGNKDGVARVSRAILGVMQAVGVDAREQLLDVALQLWADHGWRAVSLSTACALAGLEESDFLDEFPSSDDLLCEVFDASTDVRASEVLVALEEAGDGTGRWRAAMVAYLRCLEDDPRHIAVMVEAIGSPVLRTRRRSSYRGFAAVAASQSARSSGDPREVRFAAHFALGGLTEITLAWLDPDTDVDREMMLELGSRLFEECLNSA